MQGKYNKAVDYANSSKKIFFCGGSNEPSSTLQELFHSYLNFFKKFQRDSVKSSLFDSAESQATEIEELKRQLSGALCDVSVAEKELLKLRQNKNEIAALEKQVTRNGLITVYCFEDFHFSLAREWIFISFLLLLIYFSIHTNCNLMIFLYEFPKCSQIYIYVTSF